MSPEVQAEEIPETEKQQVHGTQFTFFLILLPPLYQSFPKSIEKAHCENAFSSACKKIGICASKEVQEFTEIKMHVLYILSNFVGKYHVKLNKVKQFFQPQELLDLAK